MLAVASVLSIAVFLAFASAGIQKIVVSEAQERLAERLGYARTTFQRIGAVEIAGSLAVIVGLASSRSSGLGIANEVGAGVLAALMVGAFAVHRRHGERFRHYYPALAFGLGALVELVLRLVA